MNPAVCIPPDSFLRYNERERRSGRDAGHLAQTF